jgi:hypothetical protein
MRVLTRRALLGGMSLLPVATDAKASVLLRLLGRPASAPPSAAQPLVSPGAGWTGTALSGGTPPTDPTRTTAKPAVQWLQASGQRLASNLVIGADADALGGVAYVDFWVEGSAQRVTTATVYVDTDVNGKTRKRVGYWITLDVAGAAARHPGGQIAVIATTTAKDGAMQTRTIGVTPADNAPNQPHSFYVDTVANDFIKTIAASGADYTSLKAALNAAQAAGAKSPLLTFTQTGAYELENGTWTSYTGGKGFCVITHAPGVTATLRVSSAPASTADWIKDLRYQGIEFRGSGIRIDKHNFVTLGGSFDTLPNRMNGATLTNSAGTSDTTYWEKGQPPGGFFQTASYWEDSHVEYVRLALNVQLMVIGCDQRDPRGDILSGTHNVQNAYFNTMDQSFFTMPINALTISSTVASSTFQRSGADGGGSLVLTDANGTQTITFGANSFSAMFNVSDVVAAINARTGWTATLLDDTRAANHLVAGRNGGSGTLTAVTSTAQTLTTSIDIHADVWQAYNGATPRTNAIVRNIVVLGIAPNDGNEIFFLDSPTPRQDLIFSGSVFGSTGTINGGATTPWSDNSSSHVVMKNCSMPDSGMNIAITSTSTNWDAYCAILQCSMYVFSLTNGAYPAYPAIRDCFYDYGSGEPVIAVDATHTNNISGASHTGGGHAYTVLYVNQAAGNFVPVSPTTITGNLRARLDTYDGLYNTRATSDAIGAWAVGATAPTYPF